MATVIKATMKALTEDLLPKKEYEFSFESGDVSKGTMEFPEGLTVIKIGETKEIVLLLHEPVKTKKGDKIESHTKGAGQTIDIFE